ncbi:SPOR domain-containing protein [Yoonia sp. MH D7]
MAVYDQGPAPISGAARAGALVNFAGAAVSLALIVGIGVWGYKLVMRDVSGIPVVRALEGEMRVLPENPGGEVSLHTGLAVNEVAAVGEAAGPEDSVALAPVTAGLYEEDLDAQPMAEAEELFAADPELPQADVEIQVPVALNADQLVDVPLTTDDILALADQIAAGAAPMTDLQEDDLSETEALSEDAPAATNGAVVTVSLRPIARPAPAEGDDVAAALASVMAPETPAPEITASLAVGTKLVQLGAFPSAESAATEWDRLTGRFGDVMTGKNRIIQAATSGGKEFFRLRADGFAELNDARRFCATMVAENVDCIPVVVR